MIRMSDGTKELVSPPANPILFLQMNSPQYGWIYVNPGYEALGTH